MHRRLIRKSRPAAHRYRVHTGSEVALELRAGANCGCSFRTSGSDGILVDLFGITASPGRLPRRGPGQAGGRPVSLSIRRQGKQRSTPSPTRSRQRPVARNGKQERHKYRHGDRRPTRKGVVTSPGLRAARPRIARWWASLLLAEVAAVDAAAAVAGRKGTT